MIHTFIYYIQILWIVIERTLREPRVLCDDNNFNVHDKTGTVARAVSINTCTGMLTVAWRQTYMRKADVIPNNGAIVSIGQPLNPNHSIHNGFIAAKEAFVLPSGLS